MTLPLARPVANVVANMLASPRRAAAVCGLLAGLVLTGAARRPPASYVPARPYQLALQADWIVAGTIVAVDKAPPSEWGTAPALCSTFTIEIDEIVARGQVVPALAKAGHRLRIAKFFDRTCAMRYAPYEVGQRGLYFLVAPRAEDGRVLPGPWSVIGAGNGGECPLLEKRVLMRTHGWLTAAERALGGTNFDLGGRHDYHGLSLDRAELLAAIRSLRSLYRCAQGSKQRLWLLPLEQVADDQLVERFAGSSELAGRLIADLREHARVLDLQQQRE